MPEDKHAHKFDPARKALLEQPEYRRIYPEKVLDLLPLKDSDVVADIGAGTGFFAIPLARRLPRGKVIAVDTSAEMLDYLRDKIRQSGAGNIETVLSREPDIPVTPGTVNGVMLFFVLHEAEDRRVFLAKVKSLLKPGGWGALLDWEISGQSQPEHGPPVSDRVDSRQAERLLNEAGFTITLRKTPGPDYYFMLFGV